MVDPRAAVAISARSRSRAAPSPGTPSGRAACRATRRRPAPPADKRSGIEFVTGRRAIGSASRHSPASSACGSVAKSRGSVSATPTAAPVARDRSRAIAARHLRCRRESRLVDRRQVELDRLRLDEPRRLRRHRERRDRDLRLARGVEPAKLVRGPEIDAAERQRGAEAQLGALRRALDREQEARVVALGVGRRVAERRGVEVARSAHETRRIARPASRASPRCARSRDRGGRCGRWSSRLPPSARR